MGDNAPSRSRAAIRVVTPVGIAIAFLILVAYYLLRGITDANAAYYLSRRVPRIVAIVVAGGGLGAAAATFQTLTNNRLLTPSILGIDALYILIQTAVVFVSGGGALVIRMPLANYLVSLGVITGISLTLIHAFAFSRRHGYVYLLLAGVVLTTGFRSVASFLQMLIDPNEFAVVQDSMFASLNNVSDELLLPTSFVAVAAVVVLTLRRRRLDVLFLGRDEACNLGVAVTTETRLLMSIAMILVASATALVGPLPLLGLVAANAARSVVPPWRHAALIPTAAAAAGIILLCADLAGESGLLDGLPVSATTRLVGGVLLLVLLVKGEKR